MNLKMMSALASMLALASASAQVLPTEDKTVYRTFPPEPGFQNDTQYKKAFEDIKSQVDVLRRQAEGAQRTLMATGVDVSVPLKTGSTPKGRIGGGGGSAKQVPTRNRSRLPVQIRNPQTYVGFQPLAQPASAAQTFAVSSESESLADGGQTVLPAGSFVRAKVVSGVEANALEPYPVLLHLQEAFTGPNKTRIDLSHCFMIAKARANLSTERVIMETDTISCVRDNGEHFKTQARGYTAGDDSSFGSTGTFISKQGQVLLAAVLANIAKNAGEAVALAQQSTAVVGIDKAATATNVTGDKGAFVTGKSMVDASATVAQWYLDYAKQLIPSIGIGSGQRVHVVMLDTIRVPTLEVEE
jgi:hypothetical protein